MYFEGKGTMINLILAGQAILDLGQYRNALHFLNIDAENIIMQSKNLKFKEIYSKDACTFWFVMYSTVERIYLHPYFNLHVCLSFRLMCGIQYPLHLSVSSFYELQIPLKHCAFRKVPKYYLVLYSFFCFYFDHLKIFNVFENP